MTSKTDLISAKEACQILGIKPQTLYAYASRGVLTVTAGRDKRESLYARSQIDALKARSQARSGHGPTAAGAMRWGDPILESSITNIHDERLYYRGHSIERLIQDQFDFENVAELLWSGVLPTQKILWNSPQARRSFSGAVTTEPSSSLARSMTHIISEMACRDNTGSSESIDLAVTRARTIMIQTARDLSFNKPTSSSMSIAEILIGKGPERSPALQAINTALIVSADHELNASTFAARVAASTGADLYACFTAGLGAFAGPKHGVSPIQVHQFIEECFSARSIKSKMLEVTKRRQTLPGFGHSLYLDLGDPRARILLATVANLKPVLKKGIQARLDQLQNILDVAEELDAGLPNIDMGLAGIALALELPVNASAQLFAIGRMAGWAAHVIEQRQQEFLLRPRARYIGRPPIVTA